MKRKDIIKKLEIMLHSTSNYDAPVDYYLNVEGLAKEILETIEDIGFRLVEDGNEIMYEPDEGWDVWLEEQHKKDTARDFVLPPHVAASRGLDITTLFLAGHSFEDIAKQYNVTIERIRQIVCKYRRKYK